MSETYYWYDYETTGIDPARDRVVQFAGIRTDLNFNPVANPDVFYCKLHDDILPHPEACLITGITPQHAIREGLLESEFIKRVHREFSTPQTCVVGYNSIRFDDEFTRHLLYRNFFDPYAREWKSGNSRWDLIDLVRLTHALRPDGINWPQREDGAASFKLEELTKANGILHEAAHDALSDVYATIELAKLIKQQQPRIYSWGLSLRNKKKAAENLDLIHNTAVIHVSSKYPAAQDCLAVVVPIAAHPVNKNGVLVFDLSADPTELIDLTAEEIHQRLYTPTAELNEGQKRLPLKTVHINKSPMLAPLSTLTTEVKNKLNIDLLRCEENRQKILGAGIEKKLAEVFSINTFESATDPDLMLYSGGFFSPIDVQNMTQIRACPIDKLAELSLPFEDERLEEMLFRYRARNYPETLNEVEKTQWQAYRHDCFIKEHNDGRLTLKAYFERLDELVVEGDWSEEQQVLLEELIDYGEAVADSLVSD
ncbi:MULTISPECIES: exodeoxyribonuclease I [unclassified Cycloclasticus]|nr:MULTISPECIES: exodeoxyribonuclease I [unclassified Cycloclasticus]AFT66572.1 Exonuclease I [Cycloclasticus sp. P1]MBV1898846.1 exodeoxyribonuclease I [Cycloclasticus sp.]PHR51798.1 MAG: exodeoxyribonuclease I [Cycloclasticus sp.]